MFRGFASTTIARTIDDERRVSCPIQLRDVPVEGCGSCEYLRASDVDEDGRARAIVCEPTFRALMAAAAE